MTTRPVRSLSFALAVVLGAVPLLAVPLSAPGQEPGPAERQPRGASAAGKLLVYIGTYTSGKSEGIYLCELELGSGRLTGIGAAPALENPSFLAIHPNRRFLYATSEVGNFQGTKSGAVVALAIDPQSGKLELLNQQSSHGGAPCHLVVDRQGKYVLVANYTGGSVAVLPIDDQGRLGPATDVVEHQGKGANPRRQNAPHAHAIHLDAANRFAFAVDLGLDKVLVYRFDAEQGKLLPHGSVSLSPGAGPRHFAFHPSGRFAYVINELDSTLTAFSYDPQRGALTALETVSTLPEGFQGDNTTAEVQVHPSGRFVYGSNRGHDSIAMFAVDPESGRLEALGHQPTGGKTPRNFSIDPTGRYLLAANQASDSVVVFAIHPQSGKLTPTGHELQVPTPVCVKMMPRAE